MTETTSNNNGFKQVYKSTAKVPFEVWFAPKDAEVSYPFVETAPDPKFKSPMFDWNNYRWFESDSKVQGEQISEMSQSLEKLKNDVASGKISDEAINKQIGTLVGLVSQSAIAQQAASQTTDNKADSTTDTTTTDGGAK
ncbi:hypothetical protein LDX54_08740 [Lactobacillus sp. IBH004]|uniref:hypothetical protein n=1 Tax=Lactobacillus sp. IBH004 TaxID=2879107 RepID=UPI00224445E2|nr:hypothetical protein [Lactobacillus sp. IBH004]UZN41827.1 hypothetical protein LDX54_08740 [Lactobacillus sp. IBH004]